MSLNESLQPFSLGNICDTWTFIWGSPKYTSQLFYKLNFWSLSPPVTFGWIWGSKLNMKIKVFAWLLFMDRVNTRDLLDRKHCMPINATVLCSCCPQGVRETREHLFFFCDFSAQCWRVLVWSWSSNLEFHRMIQSQSAFFSNVCFMELLLLAV